MLDKYKTSQSFIYHILNNAICNNKLSHAYLFDSNNNSDVFDIAISFAKMIVCAGLPLENQKNICNRIDEGNYLDVKIVDTDGIWLKKDDILNIQNEFSKKSIEGNKKIYIIKNAEKMNIQTANSILKFLEEPVDDIVAILITNNLDLILPTIVSRCQLLKLVRKKCSIDSLSNYYNLFFDSYYGKISSDEAEINIENVLNFALFIEKNGLSSIVYSKNIWHSLFKDRDANIMALELLINVYLDSLRYKSNLNVIFFGDKIDSIKFISDSNSMDKLINKLDIIIDSRESIKKNLNIFLLIDKMIIDMCGDNL